MADVVVVSKVSGAPAEAVAAVRRSVQLLAPRAHLVEADLAIAVERPERIAGRRVLVVEDGPTVTHGGMSHGAGLVAARRCGAAEVIDPRPFAVGTIAEAYARYPHMGPILPALGYSSEQRAELVETIARSRPDLVLDASPSRLERFLDLRVPVVRVGYRFEQLSGPPLLGLVAEVAERGRRRTP
jgi:predicted GTPase